MSAGQDSKLAKSMAQKQALSVQISDLPLPNNAVLDKYLSSLGLSFFISKNKDKAILRSQECYEHQMR